MTQPPFRPSPARPDVAPGRLRRGAARLVAGVGLALALAMSWLGAQLVSHGGTPYYLAAGIVFGAGCALVLAGRARAGLAAGFVAVAGTLGWALWEIDGKGWMHAWGFDLAGRVGVLGALWLTMALLWPRRAARPQPRRRTATAATATTATLGLAALVFALAPQGSDGADADTAAAGAQTAAGADPDALPAPADVPAAASDDPALVTDTAAATAAAGDWTAYGGSNLGQRFSPATQITPDNVARLQRVWSFATGDTPPNERVFHAFQNTPLKVGDALFVCSPSNRVFALDPASGALRWQFDPQVPAEAMEPLFSATCRAVAFHASPGDEGACARRVLLATADSRLFALDAATGRPCAGFGRDGSVDLADGMGNQAPGLSSTTAGPTVVGDRVVVGQQVSDNQRRDAPSGVVRAFDVRSGELVWAWDARRIATPREPLASGEVWPRGTPNVWATISADESLGLVYLPTGNAANDHFGGDRSAEDDEYTSAVVAVDAESGETRWHFRTVIHDIWDYDLGAQPTVMDLDVDGTTRRVVLVGTKTGSIFVLDAASGEPLRPVEMRPAPQGAVAGDWTAPAQPQSVFYPNFSGAPGRDPERLDARHAFGLTPVDAAMCRLQFHRMRYEGIYTPPTDQGDGMLLFPGTIGGLNWGGLSVDPERQLLVTNHSRLPNRVKLVPRAQVTDLPIGDGGRRADQAVAPQAGAPYGVDRPMWLSPLGVPCISPPWGYLAVTDLRSGHRLWQQPLGTGYDTGPWGLPTRLKVRIGTPNVGGAVTTRSGLVFIAAAQDDFLRAFDLRSGRLLWDARLPAGAQATPMSYVHDGRQYVAIAAGGHARLETTPGDSVVVFALPDDAR